MTWGYARHNKQGAHSNGSVFPEQAAPPVTLRRFGLVVVYLIDSSTSVVVVTVVA